MRKIIPAVVAGAAVLSLAGATFGYAVLDKDVSLSVDGAASEFSTMDGTVGSGAGEQADRGRRARRRCSRRGHQGGRRHPDRGPVRPADHGHRRRPTADVLDDRDQRRPGVGRAEARSTAERKSPPAGAPHRPGGPGVQPRHQKDDHRRRRRRQAASSRPPLRRSARRWRSPRSPSTRDDKLSTSPNTAREQRRRRPGDPGRCDEGDDEEEGGFSTTYEDTNDLDRGDTKAKTDGKSGVRTIVYSEVRHNGKLAEPETDQLQDHHRPADRGRPARHRDPSPAPERVSEQRQRRQQQ